MRSIIQMTNDIKRSDWYELSSHIGNRNAIHLNSAKLMFILTSFSLHLNVLQV